MIEPSFVPPPPDDDAREPRRAIVDATLHAQLVEHSAVLVLSAEHDDERGAPVWIVEVEAGPRTIATQVDLDDDVGDAVRGALERLGR